jgi:hypothetical protein
VRALARAIARTPPGTVVSQRIWRNDEPLVVAATATLQEVPHAASSVAALAAAAGPGWRLARIDDATRQGVMVTQIAEDGTAAEAGLSVGDLARPDPAG